MQRRCSWKKALPANVRKEEFDAHQLRHLQFRSWCDHCVKGKAVDDAHRPRIDPQRGEAKMGMDYLLARATDPQHAKVVLNCSDFQPGAVFSAKMVKGGDPHAQAVALEAIKFTGRTRLIIMCDQEDAVKNLMDLIRDSRTHETAVTERVESQCWRNRASKLRGREAVPSSTHRKGRVPVLEDPSEPTMRSRNRSAP